MTPERSHRHRRRGGVVQCSCGAGEPTIQRISWECSKYAVQRTPVISHVLSDLCFGSSQHAHSPRRHHHRTDERIVAVWQAHITEWTEEAEVAFVARDAPHRDRSEAQALPGIVSNAARSSAPDAPWQPRSSRHSPGSAASCSKKRPHNQAAGRWRCILPTLRQVHSAHEALKA